MKLTELDPRWLGENMFTFLCPHCKGIRLSCKNVVMSNDDQYELFEKEFGENWNMIMVPCDDKCAWTFSGKDFNTISVTPSLDASKSGHWHGFITNGECNG